MAFVMPANEVIIRAPITSVSTALPTMRSDAGKRHYGL